GTFYSTSRWNFTRQKPSAFYRSLDCLTYWLRALSFCWGSFSFLKSRILRGSRWLAVSAGFCADSSNRLPSQPGGHMRER
ncbi:MAG: hypothetical protein AAGU05_08780, partial [Anaerolineaceae bacterium]